MARLPGEAPQKILCGLASGDIAFGGRFTVMSNTQAIRGATSSDVLDLYKLIERGYRGDSARLGWTHQADLVDGERIDVGELTAAINDPAQKLLLTEEEGEVIACVQVSDQGKGTCYLELLCVAPWRQNRGLGNQLIGAAEQEAATSFGAVRMEMTVIERRAELIAYYGRRGYVPTGEKRPFPVEGVELPLIVLVKNIAPVRFA
jgi:ribosomal protein S18 acetylase RimI-like enzyme